MKPENEFTVLEAYTRDVGRGIARIDNETMQKLGLAKDDIIEIKGKRKTAAKCLPSLTGSQLEEERIHLEQARKQMHKTHVEEKNKIVTKFDWTKKIHNIHELTPVIPDKTIRIDGLIRNNAGIGIGNAVTVRKVVLPNAEKITVTPLQNIPPIDERYIADALDTIPITKGDNIMIPYFGGRLTFQVTDVVPNVMSIVSQKTIFSITSQGPTLREVGDFKYYSDGKRITLFLDFHVRKEKQDDAYLVLKIRLHHGGFGTTGEFHMKLEKNMIIQELVSRYHELAQEIIATENRKLTEFSSVNSAKMINDIKFTILENWKNIN